MENFEKLKTKNKNLKNISENQQKINKELEFKIEQAKKEEEEHRNFINNMQSNNRISLNDTGYSNTAAIIAGIFIGAVAIASCQIF